MVVLSHLGVVTGYAYSRSFPTSLHATVHFKGLICLHQTRHSWILMSYWLYHVFLAKKYRHLPCRPSPWFEYVWVWLYQPPQNGWMAQLLQMTSVCQDHADDASVDSTSPVEGFETPRNGCVEGFWRFGHRYGMIRQIVLSPTNSGILKARSLWPLAQIFHLPPCASQKDGLILLDYTRKHPPPTDHRFSSRSTTS